MPNPVMRVSNEALQFAIKGLGDQIEAVKKLLESYEERIRCLERAGDKTTPLIEKRIEILEKIAEAHEKELKTLKDLIATQVRNIDNLTENIESMGNIGKWGLGILTAILTTVIILLITGRAEVIFK